MRFLNTCLMVLLLCLMGGAAALAVPAYPKSRCVVQPDGSVLTLVGRGDEFCHFLATTDNYTVVKGDDGYYRYADLKDGRLVPGPVIATDVDKRLSSETNYLGRKQKLLAPALNASAQSLKTSSRSRNEFEALKRMRKATGKKNAYRGLVILVNFNDRTFSRGNDASNNFYYRMMNKEGFIRNLDSFTGVEKYTGSVRDYFSDNSDGQFVPEFDVIGPITMDVSQYYIQGVTNTYDLMSRVLKEADKQVDYSRYDSDGDGVMDMVYVIYAGYSAHYSGNDERLVWPHAGSMNDDYSTAKDLTLDGIRMGRFACSAEIYGWQEDKSRALDGIGVIVHEFSHVLGFMDHYDTSNGYQEHPNTWDVMSAGCYSDDDNRTPVAYNSYEKYAAGFLNPLNITDMAGSTISLKSTETSTDACMLRSYQDNVFFLMENRQHDKWDKTLLGHGLLVWRVDSTNVQYWTSNALNVTTRACFRLVRACGTQGSFLTGVEDTDFDPFPGTHNITELDNDEDDANLISYDGFPCPVVLRNIAEKDSIITFNVEKDAYARNEVITYELPEQFTAKAERLEGDEWVPATWTVSTRKEGGTNIISNLIPSTTGITSSTKDYSNGVYVTFTYSADVAHNIVVNAQRVSLNDDCGTWLFDLNNVNNMGTGAMVLTVDRYGIPTFKDASTLVSYCTLKPSAYMVSQKNIIDQLDVYRNVVFCGFGDDVTNEVGEVPVNRATTGCQKILEGNRIVIVKGGRKYTTTGQMIY